MADVFDFYVYDNRSIAHTSPEPIMQEDKDVAVWRFRIPKVLNNIDMSAWAWWFVYVNAKNQKFSELLTLTNDIDDPDNYCTADYPIGYGISKTPGGFTFALEAISAEQGGEISGEWHTRTYTHTVTPTLQGNQAEYAETESDVISALMQEVRTKMNQVIGGATPLPVNLKSLMTDHDKVYLYTGSEPNESTRYWYYWNGTDFVPGGVYGAGDPEAVQGYVEDWLDNHPEATTTVQDGSITENKFTETVKSKLNKAGVKDKQNDSFRFNLDSPPTIITRRKIKEGLQYFTGSDDYVYLQGACYNPTNKHIYIAVPKKDYSDCKIIEISITSYEGTYTKLQEATFDNLGHANDMTYNSNTDRLCVINEDKIVVINPLTMVTESENTIEQNMTCIAYDESENIFYLHYAMDTLLLVDGDNYNTIAKYTTDIYSRLKFSVQMFVGQGGFLYKDYFVRLYVKTPLTDKVGYQIHYLVFIKKDTGKIDSIVNFWSESGGGTEIETGWTDGNDIVLLGGGSAFTLFTIFTDTADISLLRASYYQGFERLPNGADLDNRTIQGHWVTLNDDDTQSLYHKPGVSLQGAVSIDVRPHGMYDIRQNIADESNEFFSRIWDSSEKSWSDWVRFLSDKNVTRTTFNGLQLIDLEPLKTFVLIGNYAAENITWTSMNLAGKMSQQFIIPLPSAYSISAYSASGMSSGSGKSISPEGVNSSGFVFRILTFHDEPTSANVKILFVAAYV